MRYLKTLLLILITGIGFGQPLYFSFPFPVSGSATGNTHPRITLVNDNPLVLWGAPVDNDNLFYSTWNGSGFNAPVQLTHDDEAVMLGYAEGPVIKSKGDSVFIIYVSMGPTEHRVYLRKSVDAGLTFSDTMIVNDRSYGFSLEYANMELDENGNPNIIFIRNENGFLPHHVLYRSVVDGNTFLGEIQVTPDSLGQQACECCPASVAVDANRIYCAYRNNISNIRDFYVSVSDNFGITFDSLKRIDFGNWFAGSCPASGSSSIISGDSLLSVFMTKINGQSIIKANSLHKTTLQAGPEYLVDPLFPTGSYIMNYPEIAGSGDTIGIVWHDNRNGQNNCNISVSTTGLSGLSSPQLVSDFAGNINHNPHLVFKNGIFHITWRDFSNGNVWYRKASFNSAIAALSESEKNQVRFVPNPVNSELTVQNPEECAFQLFLYDFTGRLVLSTWIEGSQKINTGAFAPGVYELTIISNGIFSSQKLVIQR
jgi:hypothetical protein